jgi:hypothetical protein
MKLSFVIIIPLYVLTVAACTPRVKSPLKPEGQEKFFKNQSA